MVRMAEMTVASRADDVLVALGLGSCIGVAIVDEGRRAAGMAHVVLPAAGEGAGDAEAKFADTAIPALVARVRSRTGGGARLSAALAGGSQMFALSGSAQSRLDIGVRNDAAARNALRRLGIPIRAAATGGSVGRTLRVRLDDWTSCRGGGGARRHADPGAQDTARLHQ